MTDEKSPGEMIMAAVVESPGVTDSELSERLHLYPPHVSQLCLWLELTGRLSCRRRADGQIGNHPSTPESVNEDEMTEHLRRWLEGDGWQVDIAREEGRGTAIAARRVGELWLIEVNGRGWSPEMRDFVGMLGELLRRMSSEEARYSVAMPDMLQFRWMWDGLPHLARRRTGITALFVSAAGRVSHDADDGSAKARVDLKAFFAAEPKMGSAPGLVWGLDGGCICVEAGREPCWQHPCATFGERMFRSGFGRVE